VHELDVQAWRPPAASRNRGGALPTTTTTWQLPHLHTILFAYCWEYGVPGAVGSSELR
jgi:hypothetical protein